MKKLNSEDIRNICLIGHGGSGKTSVGEALLFNAKATTRLGNTREETSVFDYEPEEIKRQGSISTSIHPCEWHKKKITVIDTPGDANFYVDAIYSLFVCDTAVTVISAVDGVEVQTERYWESAQKQKLPSVVVINKIDRERADFNAAIKDAQELLSKRILPMTLPIGSQEEFSGVVDVLAGKAYMAPPEGSNEVKEGEIPAEMADEVAQAKESIIENIAESDDALMEKYLETLELSKEEITKGLSDAILKGTLVPAFAVSAARNIGIFPLLDLIADHCPSPLERKSPELAEGEKISPDADAPFSAQVFKTIQDKFSGKLTVFRVWSGTLHSDSTFFNSSRDEKERCGQILVPMGKNQESITEAVPGDIVAVAKLKETTTGDTLCDEKNRVRFVDMPKFEPIISFALKPRTKTDEDRIAQALARVAEEDITLRVSRDTEAKEIVVSGMGQVHIETTVEKMRRKFEVEVDLLPPKIPYRETLKKKVDGIEGKHKKQTGGRGQFGVCYINIEPLPRGEGFEFDNKIVGGSIPRQWIPSVEKGIKDRMATGIIAGYPVVDVKVTLYDGKYHDVDSSDIAFQLAGSKAFKEGFAKAGPALLEPVMNVEIICPEDSMGDVMGDINSRRGRVLGMDAKGRNQVIKTQVPMAEMLKYAPDLNSMTGGRGSFTMGFDHYEELPANLLDKVVASSGRKEEEEED